LIEINATRRLIYSPSSDAVDWGGAMAEVAKARQARLRERARWLRGYAEEKPHLAGELIDIADGLDAEADALGGGSPTTNEEGLIC
jgi:hypothetical protein